MTSHRQSSITPELVDASSLPLDSFLFQDGKPISLDLEGVEAACPEHGGNQSLSAKRPSSRFLGRCGGLIAGFLLFLAVGGTVFSSYVYSVPAVITDFFAVSPLADAVDALLKLRANLACTNPDPSPAWEGVAGEASTVSLPAAVMPDADSGVAEVNHPGRWSGVGSLNKVREQLQLVESQQNGCELALSLMKNGKSVFSGFVPELADTGLASHTVFQARIAELELKRKSLLAKFVPQSREVRAVEEEIAAVRESFRECISAHVSYLNQRKAYLSATKAELEREFSAVSRKGGYGSHGPTAGNSVRERSRLASVALQHSEKPVSAAKAPTASFGDGPETTQYTPQKP